MGAKVLDGAVVRRGAIVGGGAVVAPGTEIPSGQVWAGCPARYLRDVDPSESAFLAVSAHNYADLSREHWNEVTKVHMVRFSHFTKILQSCICRHSFCSHLRCHLVKTYM